MNDANSGDGINVRYISGFHPVTDYAGTRHHNPAAPAGSPSGAGEGRRVAHLTGTTGEILEAATELHASAVPILYSPMLRAAVEPRKGWVRRAASILENGFTSGRGAGSAQASLARRIGGLATRVAAENSFMAGYLEGSAGIDGERIVTVGMAPLGASGSETAGGTRNRDGNLLVALCDDLTPGGNVLRLIFALEKINADAVILTGDANGEYARSCRERAEMNPRVKMILRSGNGPDTEGAAVVMDALRRAAVVVDPSPGGTCYPIVAAAVAAGIGAVISGKSACRLSMPGSVELFEPSSWELLNHAITTAFNRGAGSVAAREGGAAEVAPSAAEIAAKFREIYENLSGGLSAGTTRDASPR